MKICTTCGTEFPQDTDGCIICMDDRQYIPDGGQTWTTHEELADKRSVRIKAVHENLYELTVVPTFALGNRAFLIITPHGNILWDCIPLLSEPAIQFIQSKGGLRAIAFSHPHYYSNMHTWAETFNCPVYIHQSDAAWITDKSERIHLWEGAELRLLDGVSIINIGGHFPGSAVLHVDKQLFAGDSLYISRSRQYISSMYSYPNQIPLPLKETNRIYAQLESVDFDSIYCASFDNQQLVGNAKAIFADSFRKNNIR